MSKKNKFHSRQYLKLKLERKDLDENPFVQFDLWYGEVLKAEIDFPNAFILSTVGADGVPSSRVVLLKGYDERGFSFYSNSLSRKGRDVAENPVASLCFWWSEFERQVKIDGEVSLLPEREADEYFTSRPRQSRIGACVSKQSEVVASRQLLEEQYDQFRSERKGKSIARPEFWKGYVVSPVRFEFWQGRKNRLHDRFRYIPSPDGGWSIDRLYP
ncbi:MAG: pyridoxamine 5'-phosphate oxidase [Candidatus Dadabacteria bacterium]|nr:pyridoxamine 5'-phosphate oxidase [Candidatus Dadabacteria bacterium]MDE0291260.1 pyridoxamine 5'-phosphate oxidase [Candidatus Dadabacteria bacterium]MDE0519779.1 pyridoxamine 5'-phosphate oxidase [Candidatus Dadabacteria bacterium]MDE0662456.1 pyridoxamine 5'-phosphate oxidase [Candidatus Dadabacteria bacterium]MXW43362.1 pyridoxamine 5'-phosphate oxidase [Candidatus Dadabacteria bacterium]